MSISHPDQHPQESHHEPSKEETSLKHMVDWGYKAFWARRGKKPPKVSRHGAGILSVMKSLILLVAVICVGCASFDPIVEKAIREDLWKFTGELTEADLEQVLELYLNKKQLTKIPKGLEKLTQLTHLDLYGNQLTSAEGLEKLTQLTVLSLRKNKLTELPKGLKMLTKLVEVSFRVNQLTDEQGLEKLTQLKRLRLGLNHLTDVTGLEKLTQLKELILDHNHLTDVKGLEKLTRLTFLDLKNNPDLTKAQIAELQKALPKCGILSNPTK